MSGLGDKIRGAITSLVPPANPISKALSGDGHTTSGMDRAMQQHADKLHPAPGRAGTVRKRADGSVVLMGDADY